ncbi:791_t:CDS:1, partial [Ambispora leptoticha]
EEVPEQEVQVQLPDLSTPTFATNYPVDNNLRTQCRHVSDNDKRVVETESSKNNRCVVRSFNYGSSVKEKESHDSISTGNRQPPFPSGSGWEHISESGDMESWELCGNQPVVSSSQIETRSSNQNSYDLGRGQNGETPLPKLPEVPRQLLDLLKDDRFGFHEITSEDSLNIVWHARNLEHFSRKYGITNPRPVFLDHSGFGVWMVDEHGSMFQWNEMEKDILYMGPDLVT